MSQQHLNDSRELLAFLHTLLRDRTSGEVVLSNGEQHGKIYMREGLIVWAFATGQRESFQSILLKENRVPKERLLDEIKETRRAGKKNLDDILQALGVVDLTLRQNIIERQTKAALDAIRSWGECVAQTASATVADAAQKNGDNGGAAGNVDGFTLDRLIPNLREQGKLDTAKFRRPSSKKHGEAHESAADLPPPPPPQPVAPVHNLRELFDRFRLEIAGFVAAIVIEGKTGMPIEAVTDVRTVDPEVGSAFFRDLSRSAVEALKALGVDNATGTPLEEILITSFQNFVLIRSVSNGEHLLSIIMDRDSNPGMARVVVRRYLEQLNSFLR